MRRIALVQAAGSALPRAGSHNPPDELKDTSLPIKCAGHGTARVADQMQIRRFFALAHIVIAGGSRSHGQGDE
jgi:hypothetical protein